MDEADYICPHCGELIVIPVDFSQGRRQTYTEDCPVCCSPVVIEIRYRRNGQIDCSAAAE